MIAKRIIFNTGCLMSDRPRIPQLMLQSFESFVRLSNLVEEH